jgi:hypothetical protein
MPPSHRAMLGKGGGTVAEESFGAIGGDRPSPSKSEKGTPETLIAPIKGGDKSASQISNTRRAGESHLPSTRCLTMVHGKIIVPCIPACAVGTPHIVFCGGYPCLPQIPTRCRLDSHAVHVSYGHIESDTVRCMGFDELLLERMPSDWEVHAP